MVDPNSSMPVLFIVQEYVSGGSIDSRLWDKPRESVTDWERITWACDTAEGMCFIHSRGFTHRDLKSMNSNLDGSARIQLM